MKKLRKEVKVVLLIVGIGALLLIANSHYEKGIEECVNGGNDRQWCEGVL